MSAARSGPFKCTCMVKVVTPYIDVRRGYFSTTAKRQHMKFGVSIINIAPNGGSTYLGFCGSFSFWRWSMYYEAKYYLPIPRVLTDCCPH